MYSGTSTTKWPRFSKLLSPPNKNSSSISLPKMSSRWELTPRTLEKSAILWDLFKLLSSPSESRHTKEEENSLFFLMLICLAWMARYPHRLGTTRNVRERHCQVLERQPSLS